MDATNADHVSIDLTTDEARLVVAALRQFEPYWPSDMNDLDRIELLAAIRTSISTVSERLGSVEPAR